MISEGSELSESNNAEALAAFLALQGITAQKIIPIPVSNQQCNSKPITAKDS